MANTKIRGITIELTADTSSIGAALKQVNSELSSTQKSLNDVNRLLKFDPDNVNLLAQQHKYLEQAVQATNTKIEEEKRLLESLQGASNSSETIAQQEALQRDIEALAQKQKSYNDQLAENEQRAKGAANSNNDLGNSFKNTEDALSALAKSEAFSKISEGAKEIFDALMECTTAADQFQTSMAKVNTLAGLGQGDLAAMGEGIKSAAAEVGVGASGLADAVYQAMSAGIAAGDAVGFATQAAKLSIGGFTDSATAVDVVTTALNAYGLAADDATHVMDNLITTQNLGKTTVAELASSMGRVIPTASAYSINLDNLSAAYAEMTAKGTSTRITTTYLSAMFSELGDKSKDVNQIITQLSGQTFGQFMESGHSLGDALSILWNYADQDKEAFMDLFSSSTAATAAFSLASDGGDRFNEILAEMQDNAGALDDAFNTMAETSEMVDARFQSAFENLKIAIGDQLSPVIDELKEKGIAFLEPVTEFIQKNPDLVAAVVGATTAVVGITTAIAACTAAVALLKAAFGDLTGVIGVLGTAAVAGGIAGLSISLSSSAESATELSKSLKNTAGSISEFQANSSASVASVNKLADTISSLAGKENLTKEESKKLADAVREWNAIFPESNNLLIDTNGVLAETSDNINKVVEAGTKEYELAKKQEELTELIKARAEAHDKLTAAVEKYNEAQEMVSSDPMLWTQDWNAELQLATNALHDATAATNYYDDAIAHLESDIEDLTPVLDEQGNVLDENSGKIVQWSDEVIEAYQKAWDAAKTSLQGQRDEFLDFNTSTEETLDQLQDKFQKQAENIQQYAEIVAEAYKLMQEVPDASALLQSYIEQGPAAAGGLKMLTDALAEGGEQAAQVMEIADSFNEFNDIADSLATVMATIETGYTEGVTAALEAISEGMGETTTVLTEEFEKQQDAAEDNRDKQKEIATGTVEDMAAAVSESAPKVTESMQSLVEDAIGAVYEALGMEGEGAQSSIMYDVGMQIDSSIADGIIANANLISEALKSAMSSAISAIDLSELSSSIMSGINLQLGSLMGS